jgi:Transmembrane secretion effector
MTTPKPSGPSSKAETFAALEVPNFRRYVSGQSLSLIGTWVETVAQALLVLRLTHSGLVLGLTTAARYAPILLLSPYAGSIWPSQTACSSRSSCTRCRNCSNAMPGRARRT